MSLSITRKAPFEEPIKWKEKQLESDVVNTTDDFLEFNNLTIGATYEYIAHVMIHIGGDVYNVSGFLQAVRIG